MGRAGALMGGCWRAHAVLKRPAAITSLVCWGGILCRNQLRQDCVEALDSLLEERFAALGEAGIKRPRDALRFTNNLEYKSGAQLLCYCMFCNTRVVSTGASRVLDHLLQ